MNWRDLLYFSKGERRALAVLACLITMAWTALLLTDNATQSLASPPLSATQSTPLCPTPQKNDTLHTLKPTQASQSSSQQYSRRKQTTRQLRYPKTEKYPVGTVIELNTADTISIKKIPGIGSTFAKRIVKYRNLLGGFYSVAQLSEVYGIDEERYNALKSWFSVDSSAIHQLPINHLSAKKLASHPYLNYRQAQTIERLVKQKRKLSGWENLQLLEEFSPSDRERLIPYLSFE